MPLVLLDKVELQEDKTPCSEFLSGVLVVEPAVVSVVIIISKEVVKLLFFLVGYNFVTSARPLSINIPLEMLKDVGVSKEMGGSGAQVLQRGRRCREWSKIPWGEM